MPSPKKLKVNHCQCCNATLDLNVHYIFDDAGRRQNIAALIADHIGKQLNETDGIKLAICNQCWQQLIKYQEFRQKCIQANATTSDDDGGGENAESTSNYEYEANDCIEELPNPNDFIDSESDDMNIDYLDEDFAFDDIIETDKDTEDAIAAKKLLSLDFSDVMVKPDLPTIIDCVDDLVRIKRKIQDGIPRHNMENGQHKDSNNLDVDKIVTSNDLIDILNDDYQNENNSIKQENDFKLMKIDTEIEYLEEFEPVNIDKYLKSIASFSYNETYEPYVYCNLCPEEIISQQHLVYHIKESHTTDNGVLCIFDESCPILDDLVKVQEHIFTVHMDSIPYRVILTCVTCDAAFKSPVQFGKHMCLTLDDESTDLQCLTCDKKLKSRKRYLFHTQFHLDNARPKVCIICDKSFQSEELFYNHVMFTHEQIYEHFCGECDKSFASKARLEHHTRSQHTKRILPPKNYKNTIQDDVEAIISSKQSQNDKSFTCNICKKVYSRASRLRKHATIHEQIQRNMVLICEKCSIAFATIEDVEDHCNRNHDEIDNTSVNIISKEILFVVCCEYCESAFIDQHRLIQHKRIHLNDEKPFKCEYCMACYETYSKLKTHKNTHLNHQMKFPVQRNYMCDVSDCLKKYRHWSDLMNHRKTVHLINPSIYKCTECEATFYKSWDFSYHKKTVHSISTVRCELCQLECRTPYTLKLHKKKRHSPKVIPSEVRPKRSMAVQRSKKSFDFDVYMRPTNNGAFICNVCEKQLANRNSAKSHIEMIHLGVKHHTCEICDKEYYLRKDYNDHVRRHTAEQPYECTMCTKKFRTASMLSDHRKSHSNNRPHRCPYCVSTFKRAYVLKNHIKQHIGVRGFPCTVENCTKEYRTQWELNSHMRQKHAEPVNGDETENGQQQINTESKTDDNIIYLISEDMSESYLTNQHRISPTGIDHNYIPNNQSTENTDVIYFFNSTEDNTKSMGMGESSQIFLANQNQSNFTIMDVSTIQTIDQDIQTIIF